MANRRIPEVKKVAPLGEYRLHLVFDDGTEGDVDVARLVRFHGVFEPLRDVRQFKEVFVDPEGGTIAWPNGADLDPIVLYATVTGKSIDQLLASTVVR